MYTFILCYCDCNPKCLDTLVSSKYTLQCCNKINLFAAGFLLFGSVKRWWEKSSKTIGETVQPKIPTNLKCEQNFKYDTSKCNSSNQFVHTLHLKKAPFQIFHLNMVHLKMIQFHLGISSLEVGSHSQVFSTSAVFPCSQRVLGFKVGI